MFVLEKDGRYSRVRLHPNVLQKLQQAVLICQLARISAKADLARIAVTPSILACAEEAAVKAAPRANVPLERQRFGLIRQVFEPIGLLDPDKKIWNGRKRVLLKAPGDAETIAAALEHGDDFIITDCPKSLPQALLFPIDVQAVTPGEMIHAFHEQAPSLMVEAMQLQKQSMGVSHDMYHEYLQRSGHSHLIQLAKARVL
jgi:hypothetical protein